jgi:hypothetical protein
MNDNTSVAWLTLNSRYYAAPIGNPLALLNDAQMLMKSAHAVAFLTRDLILLTSNTHKQQLMLALQAVETLTGMAEGCIRVAQVRFVEMGDAWLTGEFE